MGWDLHVYLAKKRITKKALKTSLEEMRRRFGSAPIDPDDDDDVEDFDEDDDETFSFARFRIRFGEDAACGPYLWISSDDVGSGRDDAEEAGHCMSEWAELLGGEISEEEWSERGARAQSKRVETLKLPKFGPADTFLYIAFDALGQEKGRKSVAKEMADHVKMQILEPKWLVDNGVVRIEYLSFGCDGTVGHHETFEVTSDGQRQRVERF